MPWCPKCRAEYREGFTTCSDCGTDLADEPGPPSELKKNGDIEYDREAYLTSVSNRIEAEMVEALLNSEGIPVLKKFRETGGFLDIYMGAINNFGVDLYVPSKLLENAKEIIASSRAKDLQDSGAEDIQRDTGATEFSEFTRKYKNKRTTNAWIVLLFLFPGLLWLIVTVFNNLYRWLSIWIVR